MNIEEYKSKWFEFEEVCRNCNACSLSGSATNKVIFRGARHAPLMIIGEAPGEQEDREGKPFVGKSGQLLQNLLEAQGFEKKHYHICNVVKCRPPENRKPDLSEMNSCKKLLATQFMLVKPKIILLCGSTAYEAFYGQRNRMSEIRGFIDDKNGYKILTTYHPSYCLRNPDSKVQLYQDVEKVKKYMIDNNLF